MRYREATWERLQEEVFDVFVIGGGINGAAVARDAVLRGMSVGLAEMNDFASGTSSRSSKLIHGGVRYIEHGELGLVLEACRERDLLRTRLAPHLVRGQRFIFPVYDGDPVPAWQLRAGLFLYDLLASFRNVQNHSWLSRKEVVNEEPELLVTGLKGGAAYYDCWTDDARLTLATMLAARAGGAAVLNHAEVVTLEKDSSGRLASALVRDRLTDRRATVRARAFVNVAGPWLDRVRRFDDAGAPPRLRATKGVHAVFERARVGNRNAVVIRGVDDGRVMFAIPWQRHVLVGTTDTWYDGDPADVKAERSDVDYLLASVNRAFPRADLCTRDVTSTYAGLRPLVEPEDELDESEVSRDDRIFESPSGLLSLGGGKLTTHRHVAERMVDRAADFVGRSVGGCRTAVVPLPGGAGIEAGDASDEPPRSAEEHVRMRYGALGSELSARVRHDQSLGQPLAEDLPDLRAELLHAVDQEMALTVEDVLTRRTHVTLKSQEAGSRLARSVAELLGARLGWEPERIAEESEAYLSSLPPTFD